VAAQRGVLEPVRGRASRAGTGRPGEVPDRPSEKRIGIVTYSALGPGVLRARIYLFRHEQMLHFR